MRIGENLLKAVLIQALLSVNLALHPARSPKGPDYCEDLGEPYRCHDSGANHQHIFCNCLQYKCHFVSSNETRSRQFALHWHNKLRNRIAMQEETENAGYGGPIPQAADMNALSWNYAVEDAARCNAKKCVETLQPDECHATPQYLDLASQNLYKTSHTTCKTRNGTLAGCDENTMTTWEILLYSAIQDWYQEFKDITDEALFGVFQPKRKQKMIGHVITLLWALTTEVGCGVATDQKEKEFFVTCNYLLSGNIPGERVFTTGPAASRCAPNMPAGQEPAYRGLCGRAVMPPEPPVEFFISLSSSSLGLDPSVARASPELTLTLASCVPKSSPMMLLSSLLLTREFLCSTRIKF